jgi:hypothetical protein
VAAARRASARPFPRKYSVSVAHVVACPLIV